MTPISLKARLIVAAALLIPVALSIAVLRNGTVMSPSTYAVIAVIVIGIATVTLMAIRNAQPTESVAHVLHDTENPR